TADSVSATTETEEPQGVPRFVVAHEEHVSIENVLGYSNARSPSEHLVEQVPTRADPRVVVHDLAYSIATARSDRARDLEDVGRGAIALRRGLVPCPIRADNQSLRH